MITLVHVFVASHVDYCNTVLVASPKSVSDKLQRVLNATVGTRKFVQRLSHADWHRLDGRLGVGYVQLTLTLC